MALATSCAWCGTGFDPGASPTCPRCGAPAAGPMESTASGWLEVPSLSRHTRIQMGRSSARIEGTLNPVLFADLAEGEGLSFGHRNLLWSDPHVRLGSVKTPSASAAMLTEVPWRQVVAMGPAGIGLAAGAAGELSVLPLDPGAVVDVRPGSFLASSVGLGLELVGAPLTTWEKEDDGMVRRWPMGTHLIRLSAPQGPGVAFLAGAGDQAVRRLAEGEALLVRPDAISWYDASVRIRLCVEGLRGRSGAYWQTGQTRAGLISNLVSAGPGTVLWAELWGPGRIAISTVRRGGSNPGAAGRYYIDPDVTVQLDWGA